MKILILALLFSPLSYAISVQELSQLALEHSSNLKAQELEAHALEYEANVQGKWKNPQLMSQLGTFKSGSVEASTVELSLTQSVPLSDKYSLRKELALVASQQQKKQSEFFKNWVSHQVIIAAWRVYLTHELFSHGKARTSRFNLIKRYLDTRPKLTIKQKVEHSLISSQLLQMEKSQEQKSFDYETARKELAFWLGRDLSIDELPFKSIPTLEQFPSFKVDLSKDTEFLEAAGHLKMSQLDRELASKERRPDLYLGGGYRVENISPKNHFTYAIVGLDIPLWDTGSNRLEMAKIREKKNQRNYEETEKRLLLKQQKQIEAFEHSVKLVKKFPQKLIGLNEKMISEAELGFKQGLIDVNTFVQAETQSHEIIDQVFISWMTYIDNLSSLQLVQGENFNWETK